MRGVTSSMCGRMLRWGRCVGALWLLLVSLAVRPAVALPTDSVPVDPRVAHLLQLAKDVRWPDLAKQQNFYIEVIGKTSLFTQELKAQTEGLSIRRKPVEIMVTDSWEGRNMARRPNILFVTSSAMAYLPQICNFFSGYPVLVVSERPYYRDGWMVSFSRNINHDGARSGVEDWNYTINAHNIETIAGLHLPKYLRDGSVSASSNQVAAYDVTTSRSRGAEVEELRMQLGQFAADIKSLRLQLAHQSEVIAVLRDSIELQRSELVGHRASSQVLLAAGSSQDASQGALLPLTYAGDDSSDNSALRGASAVETTGRGAAPSGDGRTGLFLLLGLAMLSGGVVCAGVAYSRTARKAAQFVSEVFRDVPVTASMATAGVLVAPVAKREKSKPGASASQDHGAHQGHDGRAHAAGLANGARGEYLATVSHEIRTPLNAIVGLSQYLATASTANEEMHEGLGVINRNAFELNRKMSSMVMLASLDSCEVEVCPAKLHAPQVLASVEATGRSYSEVLGLVGKVAVRSAIVGPVGEPMLADAGNLTTIFDTLLGVVMRNAHWGVVEFGCMAIGGGLTCFVRSASTNLSTRELEALYSEGRAPLQLDLSDASTEAALELSVASGLLALQGVQLMVSTADGVGQEYTFQPRLG